QPRLRPGTGRAAPRKGGARPRPRRAHALAGVGRRVVATEGRAAHARAARPSRGTGGRIAAQEGSATTSRARPRPARPARSGARRPAARDHRDAPVAGAAAYRLPTTTVQGRTTQRVTSPFST